jgi:uncharacterized protein (TIGR02284 family)
MNETTTEHCIDVCNRLLRGERSAVETYNQAIERFTDSPARPELERIRTEHHEAVNRLIQSVREMGGTPDESSGSWGVFARGVQGAANLFGAGSAVSNLQNGEEHGRSDYEDALQDEDVMPEHKAMIRDELLPRIQRHISTLERLEDYA